MKKTNLLSFLAFAGLVAVFSSCEREDILVQTADDQEVIDEEYEPIVIEAVTSDMGSKAQMAYRYDVLWQLNDKITVKGNSGTDTFTLTSGAGTTRGTFKQDGEVKISGAVTAYYPSEVVQEDKLVWPGEVTTASVVPMMASQNISGDKSEKFAFTSIGSVLQLALVTTDANIKLRSIRVVDGEKSLSGSFTIQDGKAVIDAGSRNAMVLDLGEEGVSLSLTTKYFNIPIPAGKYNNMTIILTSTDGKKCKLNSKTMPEFANNTVNRVSVPCKFKEIDYNNYKGVTADGHKIATIWIELLANSSNLQSKESVNSLLDNIKSHGFNAVVFDIRPVNGYVLYKTDYPQYSNDRNKVVIPRLKTLNGTPINTIDSRFDEDLVKYMVDQCHDRGMKITLAASILAAGNWNSNDGKGLAYINSNSSDNEMTKDENVTNNLRWPDMCCWEWLKNNVGSSNIANNHGGFAFMSPSNSYVHDYVIAMVKEIVSKYQPDGLALDYLRYKDELSDTRGQANYYTVPEGTSAAEAFANYMKTQYGVDDIGQFPQCAFYNNGGKNYPGTYYNEWMEYRAYEVQRYVMDIREAAKAIKSDIDIELWADAYYPKYNTGQNWGNKDVDYRPSYADTWWRTPNYYKTGFANYLDIFQLGSYRAYVTKAAAQAAGETALTASIEGSIENAKLAISDACKIYGTFELAKKNSEYVKEACTLCLNESDGLMVFDLCYVTNVFWDALKQSIVNWRYENEDIGL